MKKIDFSKIVVKDINGNPYAIQEKVDGKNVKKECSFCGRSEREVLGNGMFYNGKDVHFSELGQKIYHHEEVELTEEDIKSIRDFINDSFVPFVLLSVNPQLDELLK